MANVCRVVLLPADFVATLVVRLFNKLEKFAGRTATRAAELSLTSDAWPATLDSRDSMMVLRAACVRVSFSPAAATASKAPSKAAGITLSRSFVSLPAAVRALAFAASARSLERSAFMRSNSSWLAIVERASLTLKVTLVGLTGEIAERFWMPVVTVRL